MYLTSEKKAELFAKYGNDAKNTGSAESQIALFTFRINHLTEHLKQNRKDFAPLQDFVQFNKPSFKKQCKGTAFCLLLQSRLFGKLYP